MVHRAIYIEVGPHLRLSTGRVIGHQIWVRWDSRCVRVFNERMEQIQIHSRVEPGRSSRVLGVGGLHAPVLDSCRIGSAEPGFLAKNAVNGSRGL